MTSERFYSFLSPLHSLLNYYVLSEDDSMAEGDGSGTRDISSDTTSARNRELRHAFADHPRGCVDAGQYRGGLDARDSKGQGALSGHSIGFFG